MIRYPHRETPYRVRTTVAAAKLCSRYIAMLLHFPKNLKKLTRGSTIALIALEISSQGMRFAEVHVEAAKDI
jgi:hypothetical protein